MGQISIEISQMTRLVTLDISWLELENQNLQKLVQNLADIKQLYLDGENFIVSEHEWWSGLLSLHDLQELSMPLCHVSGPLDPSLARLENLSAMQHQGPSDNCKHGTILKIVDHGSTSTLWNQLVRWELSPLIYINKFDHISSQCADLQHVHAFRKSCNHSRTFLTSFQQPFSFFSPLYKENDP